MAYEYKHDWTLGKNKPKTNPICQRVKLMQSAYLQRIMKKNADRGYEKTKPKQTQNEPNQTQFQRLKTAEFKVLPLFPKTQAPGS